MSILRKMCFWSGKVNAKETSVEGKMTTESAIMLTGCNGKAIEDTTTISFIGTVYLWRNRAGS